MRKVRPDVPWSLESIVRRCLAADPARRYQRAEHLAEDLHASLRAHPSPRPGTQLARARAKMGPATSATVLGGDGRRGFRQCVAHDRAGHY